MSEAQLEETLVPYQQYLERSGLAPVTVKAYVADIKRFAAWLAPERGKSPLESTSEDIRSYCVELAMGRARPPATVNRSLQSIRKFLGYAWERGLVVEDPSSKVKLLPQRKSLPNRGLDQSEIERLLDAVRNAPAPIAGRDYAIVQVMLQTGIRVGELTQLQVSDISVSDHRGLVKISSQDTHEERRVPLNASARKAITAYLNRRPASSNNHLFLSRKGGPLSVRSVQRLVSTYAQAADLESVSTHTLRQTCGQHMLRDTGDLTLVARFLGHKRVETAVRYVLPGQEDLTEVAEKSSLNVY